MRRDFFEVKSRKGLCNTIKTTLKIDGMMCGMCESHLNDLVRSNCKVKKVTSSAKKGETVIVSESEPDIEMLREKIAGIGYQLLSSESEPYESKFSFFKK